MTDIFIEGGRALLGGEILEASLQIAHGQISAVGSNAGRGSFGLDAGGLLVLPGIIDLHGDAFERQIMPRPGVDFPIDVALIDSDRQAIGNGITTVFHATTWSWEPGLRSADNARQLLEAIETLRPQLAADTRFHLRHETYNHGVAGQSLAALTKYPANLLGYMVHEVCPTSIFSCPQYVRISKLIAGEVARLNHPPDTRDGAHDPDRVFLLQECLVPHRPFGPVDLRHAIGLVRLV